MRPAAFVPALMLIAAVYGTTAPAQDQSPAAAPKVIVAAAAMREVVDDATFVARVEAVDAVDLIARVEGFLEEIVVKNGQRVRAGDRLFEIEAETYAASVAGAEADLARAEANLALARVELDRRRQLVARDAAPQSELDVALANEKVAEADLAAAEAALRRARLNLSYTGIAAPIEGRIGRVQSSVGDLVGPGTGALATIVRERPIFVTFSLSERQYTTIVQQTLDDGGDATTPPADLPVTVTLANGTTLDETGALAFTDNRIDPSTGTIAVRAQFANASGLLVDGAFVSVRIAEATPTARLVVPQAAVQRDQRGDFVLVIGSEQTVEQRYIETGRTVGTDFIVTSGLQDGESVIVEGLQRVRPGVPVDPVLRGTAASEG